MPTSSIFHNFTITDEETAERFVETLEKAAAQHAWKPRIPYKPPIRDPWGHKGDDGKKKREAEVNLKFVR